MTDEEFSQLDKHKVENLVLQRDDSLRRVEALEVTVKRLTETHVAEVQSIRDAHEAEKVRDAKRRELDQRIAEIERLKAEIG